MATASLRVAPQVRVSMHPDGVVLIHLEKGAVFSTNRAGALIWAGATKGWNTETLVRSICGEFNITPQIAERDLAEFLEQLKKEGLLIADAT